MTIYNVNFDVDAVLRAVEGFGQRQPLGSPEEESLRICAAALLFVRDEQHQLDAFREYFRKITTPALQGIRVDHTFDTREAAERWLQEGSARDGQRVRITGQGFIVLSLGARGLKLVRMPLPDELVPPKP